jgi:hypothetical protein
VRSLDYDTLEPISGPLGDFFAFDTEDRCGVYVSTSDLVSDINADGRQDLVVGAGAGRTADVIALDGKTGETLYSGVAFGNGYTGGARHQSADG